MAFLLTGIGFAASWSPIAPPMHMRSRASQVTMVSDILSGDTLTAALKMRCDNSGAGYAIYWETDSGEVTCKGTYTTPARKEELKEMGKTMSFADASVDYKLSVDGTGPIATVLRNGAPLFIPDAAHAENLRRKDLAAEYGVESIAVIPFESGVLEFGTSTGDATAQWKEMPTVPVMPKLLMAKAFNQLSASYFMYWELNDDGRWEVKSDFVRPARLAALSSLRNDGETFCSQSRQLTLPNKDTCPVARCVIENNEIFIDDMQSQGFSKVLRADLAKEFGIKSACFVPVEGGCFEYGIPA